MVANTSESPLNDPIFKAAMQNLQIGKWQEGLDALNLLIENYPLSHELRALRQEMQLRAHIDNDELVDQEEEKKMRFRRGLIRIGILGALFLFVLWGIWTYSSWIENQWTNANQKLENEVRSVELAVKFRSGQNMMQAGRWEESEALFQEIAAVDPEYPGLDATLQQIGKMLAVDTQYDQAIRLLNLNDRSGALSILESIKAQDPYYKDVTIRINEINNLFFLDDLYAQAEKSFEGRDWVGAVSGYETVRAINPQFQQNQVEERLLASYINAAYSTLEADEKSFEALETAEAYYRKALALRPQDPNVRLEREKTRQVFRESLSRSYVEAALSSLGGQGDSLEALKVAEEYFQKAFALTPDNPEVQQQYDLAQSYLQAQDDFLEGNYEAVIEALETVYQLDPLYASGTAQQTLYEAHIGLGNAFMAGGEYLLGLQDFQRAAAIAEQNPNSLLSLYEAKIKVAEAHGALANYEDSVFIYQEALDLVNLSAITQKSFDTTRAKLEEADRLAGLRYYRSAYKLFKAAAPDVITSVATTTHIVKPDDYLASLANRYNTTIEAIIAVNNLISPKQIQEGQELIIPASNQE